MGDSQVFAVLSRVLVAMGESALFAFCFSVPDEVSLTMYSTSYPSFQQPPSQWPPPNEEPPNSAQSWTYGQYRPGGTPAWPPAQPPAWGQTPVSPWAPTTPAGTWGALSSNASYVAQTPSGYPGFGGYGPRPQPPYFGPNTPTTPYDSSAQPITSGWYGAENAQQKKKDKKRRSFREQNWGWDDVRRSNSMGHVPLQRSASWGYLNTPVYGHEPYSTLNLARRPRDWRPDYTPREGIAALATYLPRVTRSKSEVRGPFHPPFPFFPLLTPPQYRILGSHPQATPPTPPLGAPISSHLL